jgi:hypothetical protein
LSVGEARVEDRFLLDHQTAIDVSRIIQDLKHKELFIGAREHYKSTFLRARAVWRLCQDSNRAILILRATLKRAREVVQAIRDLIDKSPKLQVYWPEIWKGEKGTWSTAALVVPGRTSTREDPSVRAGGLLNFNLTGAHPDEVLCDDLEDLEQNTATSKDKLARGLISFYPFLNSTSAVMAAVGTYYHTDGLHAKTMPQTGWHTIRYSAVFERDCPDETFFVTLSDSSTMTMRLYDIGGRPKMLDPRVLGAQKLALDAVRPGFYASQYLCRIPSGVVGAMDVSKIKYFLRVSRPTHAMRRVLCVDPAMGRTEFGDHTALSVFGVDGAGNYHLLGGGYARSWTQPDRIRIALNLMKQWSVQEVRWETYNTFFEDLRVLDVEIKKDAFFKHRPPIVHAIEGKKASKKQAIKAWVGDILLAYGRFYLPVRKTPEGDLVNDLRLIVDDGERRYEEHGDQMVRDEINAFPGGRNDGFLDTLTMLAPSPDLPSPKFMVETPMVTSARAKAYRRLLV